DASRYQAYLCELGLEFARNGRRTNYPPGGSLAEGFTLVTPDAAEIIDDFTPTQCQNFFTAAGYEPD
ncbi:MAG TPA: hypothetical protein QF630_06005, partial [Alphaproteobacteria bacterium]|nr:hypothetical protein [Alphaproteobacteria bacterium]